jgi:competence protein ComEC
MRASGLAHILSISGLHMAIVGGFAFGLVRLLIAAWPWLALRVPGKKIAALAGLVAVGLSGDLRCAAAGRAGGDHATVAFAGHPVRPPGHHPARPGRRGADDPGVKPESAGAPGFQMSFAATAALVALAEAWPRRCARSRRPGRSGPSGGIVGWLAVSVGASFVAGLATAPFAMQHFNRVAVWGLPANLAVAPLSSFVIMPFLALGAALEPSAWADRS